MKDILKVLKSIGILAFCGFIIGNIMFPIGHGFIDIMTSWLVGMFIVAFLSVFVLGVILIWYGILKLKSKKKIKENGRP